VARHPDFPSPVGRGVDQRFSVVEVALWLDQRAVPADSLLPGEARGATYGSRFRLATGLSVPENDAEDHEPPVGGLLVEKLRTRLRELLSRGDEPAAAETAILSLHCMRIVDPVGWRQMMAAKRITFDALERARGRLSSPLAQATAVLEELALDPWRCDRLIRLVHSLFPAAAPSTFEHLLDGVAERRGGSSGEYLMPTRLARLMVAMVDPQPGDHIQDPCCGHGSLLVASGRYLTTTAPAGGGSAVLTGRAATKRSHAIATMNVAVHQVQARIDRDPSDDLSIVDVDLGQFDVVLLNPPFGRNTWRLAEAHAQRQWPYGEPPPHSVAFAWVQAAAEALGPAGRAAVLMPASSTSPTATRERDIRERLLDRGVVRCVVELPAHLFRETTVPVTVWILGPARSTGARDVLLIDGRAAAERVSTTHRELTEQGCHEIVALYRGMLGGSLPFPLTYDKPSATAVDLSELREHGYELRPSAYLNRYRSPAAVERTPDDLRGLPDELIRLDAAAQAADRDLEEQLRRLAQWTR
jgi:type I restriction enzyme M protein